MNEDMSDMIKNLSNMLNSKDMPDDIKNIINNFSSNNKNSNAEDISSANTLLIHLLLKATQI